MLRIAGPALLCAVFIVAVASSSHLAASKPSAPEPTYAERVQAEPSPAPGPSGGHVRAVERRERFDPFGKIVPLPVVTREQLLAPAFDPTLYRGGRVGEPLERADLCEVIEEVAEEFDLPSPLFMRLIWQESRFRNETVSRAGAQGIAQFMPRTAELRGLDDPFDPLQALPASADFLRELTEQFGNFGLAAAAYNGGPTRVRNWLAGRISRLPKETRNYVLRITGRTVEYWRRKGAEAHPRAFHVDDCQVKPIRAAASD